jgi:hypothetical protein
MRQIELIWLTLQARPVSTLSLLGFFLSCSFRVFILVRHCVDCPFLMLSVCVATPGPSLSLTL